MHWKLRDLLHRRGPTGLMVGSLAVVGLLLMLPLGGVPGYAEVAPVRLSSLEVGIVASVAVGLGDVVRTGDIVGILDDGPLQGRIRILQAELARRGASLQDAEAGARTNEQAAKADLNDAYTRLSGAKESLRIAEARLATKADQVTRGIATQDTLGPLQAEVTVWNSEVQRLSVLAQRRSQVLQEATSRMEGGDDGAAPAVLTEVRARGVVQEELALLGDRLERMTLRSPVDARVVAVHYRVGEVLPAQTPLVELLPLETKTVAACLPEQFVEHVQTGSTARLHPASGGTARDGVVIDVMGLVSEAPERCKQRPNEIGWVRPVRIAVDGGGLVPGQRFDVRFGPPAGVAP